MLLRHALSILILPFTVTVIVPALLLQGEAGQASMVFKITGGVLFSLGLVLVVSTIWQFAVRGRGTLAPWDPTRKLVLDGVYRHVRNPMITGVFLILLSESLWFASWKLGIWAAAFIALNAIYIPLVEERGLADRFGADYETYKQHVPRWIPRASPWEAEEPYDGAQDPAR